MAEFNTDTYTGQNGTAGQSSAVGYPQAKLAGGKLRYLVVPYITDGAEVTGDTINLGKLKVGAVPLPTLSRINSQAAFDCDDVNIGTTLNVNSLADALDTTNAELDQPFVGGDNRFAPVAITAGDEDIIATLVSVVTTTAGQLVLFLIAYVDE